MANSLTAAAQSIAQRWKGEEPLIFREQECKLWHVFVMNKLTAAARFYAGDLGAMNKFWKQWSVYAAFINMS